MAGTGFRYVATFHAPNPRFATTRITPWQTALKYTADCQAPLSGSSPGLWQSALKFRLLTVAIRDADIFLVAILGDQTADCHSPRYTFNAECSKKGKSTAPAILLRESPCSRRHVFVMRDTTSVKPIRG
jgi:hypothetical protein